MLLLVATAQAGLAGALGRLGRGAPKSSVLAGAGGAAKFRGLQICKTSNTMAGFERSKLTSV